MNAIEFETYITQNIIHIPMNFSQLNNRKAKITVHIDNHNQQGNYDTDSLLLAFDKVKNMNVFKEIDNSVLWQQDIRNEWE